MRKSILFIPVAAAAVLIAVTGCVPVEEQKPGTANKAKVESLEAEPTEEATPAEEPTEEATPAPTKKAAPTYTHEQANAIEKAEDYLNGMAFSRSGLIEQLKYEGYSTKDATFAVDHIKVNWFTEAALKAEDYLDGMAFSRSGLLEQLRYEGFTQSQAEYGVNKAY